MTPANQSTMGLFPPSAEEARQERSLAIDAQIGGILMGDRRYCPWDPAADQCAILRALRYKKGLASAVGLRELTERLKINARSIKGHVRSLVMDFRVPIGASKHSTEGGYYLIVTPEEQRAAAKMYIDEAVAMIARAQIVASPHIARELLGQLTLGESHDR